MVDPQLSDTPEETVAPELSAVQAQLTDVQGQLAASQAEVVQLQDKNKALEKQAEQMKGIVLNHANHMSVALGGTPFDLNHLDVTAALTHHAVMSDKINATFKGEGPVSAAPVDESEAPETELSDPAYKAGDTNPIHNMVREHQNKS